MIHCQVLSIGLTTRRSCCGWVTDGERVKLRLCNLSRDNLYQIRKRLTAKLQETVLAVLAEMEL